MGIEEDFGLTFELEETEQDKKRNELYQKFNKTNFKPTASKVIIKRFGKDVGHIFTPAGSGNDIKNAIQICGFTEAFDLWGCGIYEGYKDIELLFDDGVMGGLPSNINLEKCVRCYRHPCQCDNKRTYTEEEIDNGDYQDIPFNVKTSKQLKDDNRLIIKKEKK